MIGRLNHVAVAVPDLTVASVFYAETLGAVVSPPRALHEHGVTVVFVILSNSKIELLAPLGESSPIRRYLDRHPTGGMHHICFEVDDLLTARDQLLRDGARLLGDGIPRIGAHGLPVLFLDPRNAFGTLIELEEVGRIGIDAV